MAIETEVQEVRKWHARIATSDKFRMREARRYNWEASIEKYKGHYREISLQFDFAMPIIQLVFAYIKTEVPRLYVRDPHIKVNPKKSSSIQSAKILEQALNYVWRVKRLKNQIKQSIVDGKLTGHAWFKTGYTGKFGTIEDHEGNVMEFIESEDFFGYRIPWKHIYFDVDSVNPPHDTRWIAHEFWVPVEDLKKDKRFKHVDKIQGSPKERINADTAMTKKEFESDVLMARLYEVWDMRERKVFTIAEGVERYVEKPKDWPYDMKGFPFSLLRFHTVNDEAYGIPDVYMIQDQILEKIKMRASQLDHVKKFGRQYVTEPNNLDDENKSLLSQGITGAVIEANKGAGSVAPLAYPPVPQDGYAVEDRITNDQIIVSGQNPVESGAPAKAPTRTIREVIEQQQGAENRRSEQIDVIEDYVEDISQNLIALLQQFADTPFYVSVTGEDPQTLIQQLSNRPSAQEEGAVTNAEGFTFTKDDIQGEFDIDVVAGSTVPLNKATTIELLQQIAPLAQQLGAIPGGPLAGTIGRMFGELLDMPEIKIALDQELQAQQQLQQAQQEAQTQQQQLDSATEAAQVQMQGERIAVQNQKNILNAAVEAAKLRQEQTKNREDR